MWGYAFSDSEQQVLMPVMCILPDLALCHWEHPWFGDLLLECLSILFSLLLFPQPRAIGKQKWWARKSVGMGLRAGWSKAEERNEGWWIIHSYGTFLSRRWNILRGQFAPQILKKTYFAHGESCFFLILSCFDLTAFCSVFAQICKAYYWEKQ